MFKGSWGVAGASSSCGPGGVQARLPRASHMLAALVVTLLSGCAVGPDFQAPPAPDVAGYTRGRMPAQTTSANVAGGQAQHFERDRDIPGDWWELFHSKPPKWLGG